MNRKLLAAAAIFMFYAPAQADVTNGGFETGSFSGWTQTGNTGFNGVQCPGPSSSVDSGNCSAFFGPAGSTGGITQNVTTVSGQQYTILFSLLTDDSTISFSAQFGGTTLLSLTTPGASGGFTDYSFTGTATGTSTALSFLFRDDLGFTLLDSISVVERAVPEPSSWALMLLGFGAIGFAMRRHRSMSAIIQRA
jgi:hypothetical protein